MEGGHSFKSSSLSSGSPTLNGRRTTHHANDSFNNYLNMEEDTSSLTSDLRQELVRLQDREALLTHLLLLEREKRVRAEQLVEVEHLACLELGHRLTRERKLVAAAGKKTAGLQRTSSDHGGEKDDGSLVQERREEIKRTDSSSKSNYDRGLQSSPPVSSDGSDSSLVLSSPVDSNFSMAVFGQLTPDLRHMLRVGASKDAGQQSSQTDRVTMAREAIETDDAGTLQKCIFSMDLDTLANEGEPLLELASEYGRTGCVKVLLDSGSCNPNGRGTEATPTTTTPTKSTKPRGDGLTPLHLAAKNGHHNTLSLLLKSGADPHQQDNEGCSPLFLATRDGHLDCVQSLMEHGAKVATLTKLGETALHAAVLANSPAILRNLIVQMRIAMETVEMTSVLNHCDSDGRTALHLAASLGYKECAEVLCARADVDTIKRDRWNRTPIDVATPSCKEILLNRESRQVVVYVESCGSSPVHSSSNLTVSDSDYRTAIGRISILQHHKLPDLELLVQETLQQYWSALKLFGNSRSIEDSSSCGGGALPRGLKDKLIDGINFWEGCGSLHERILRAFSLSKSFVHREDGSFVNQDFKELYLKWSKAFLQLCRSRTSAMDLNEESILSYRIGSIYWKPGEIPVGAKLKNLFSVFGELERQQGQTCSPRGGTVPMERESRQLMEVTVSLKGFREGCLDQLAFDSMIPLLKLKEYANLIEENKALMIQGAQGTGKTYLALALANHFKYKYVAEGSQVIHISLHPSFQRDDLFRLLHINGLLVPASDPEKGEELSGGRRSSTVHASRTYILILDDLSNVVIPSVLAELLTTLSYQGAEHPMWISDVFGRDGSLLYPCGYYYLYPKCYFIATQTPSTSNEREPSSIDQFPHISLDCHSEPVTGVLRRQLTAKLIHCSLGDLPYTSSFLPRLLLWTVDVWLLYNHLVQSLDLPELACGIKNFLQCPLESKDPEVIINWICSIWNLHLAPSIENTLQSNSRLSVDISAPHRQFGGSPQQSDRSLEEHRYKALMQLLLACTRLVFLPTCPLQLEMRLKVVEQLTSRLEGLVGLSAAGERMNGEQKTTEMQRKDKNAYSSAGTPPLSSHMMNRGTPPTPSKERRGSLSKHSPSSSSSSSKAGNMVSYEDMIKNSPRNTPKVTRSKQQIPTTPQKAQPVNVTEPVKPVTPVISPKRPPSGEGSPMIVDEVKLRQSGRTKTLRKLRSKTVALFSKEGGYSTLPRLFRKGSRASLTSFSEDDPKKPHRSESQHVHNKSEKQQLNDLFDILSSSSHSSRYEDQRSPPPESLPTEGEGEETDGGGGDNDLDDIFDLMATINSDRIDDQRTAAPPTPTTRHDGAVSPDKSKKKNKKKVAKYFLPTGSPLLQRKTPLDRTGATSPANFSMPDLTAENDLPPGTPHHHGHYSVTRSNSNTPSRARARLVSDAYVHCRTDNPSSRYTNGYRGYSYHSAHKSTVASESDKVRRSSFSSDSQYADGGRGNTSAYFRKRAGTFDYGSSSATDPVARRIISVYGRSQEQSLASSSSCTASNPSVSHQHPHPLPPTSPLATTGYSSSYQDAFCYTDSDGSPFISHQHTQSNSTTNTGTASLIESSPFVSHEHTQSNSTTHTASQNDDVGDTSNSLMHQYQQAHENLQAEPSSGYPESSNQDIRTAKMSLDQAPSVLRSRRFQAKSEQNLHANGDDGGAFDLFRAASDGEINQSSTPSPYQQEEEENSFQFRATAQQPPNNASQINSTKGTSITMMHCNYHSIYPEESPQPAKVEKYFTSTPYSSRTRSVSTTGTDPIGFDGISGDDSYNIYRRRSATVSRSSQDNSSKRMSDTYVYSKSSASTASERRHSAASAEQRYRRNTSNSSEGSSLSQTLSSPTSKVPRGRKPSDATSLLFSATLGFSDLLNAGSRDRLPSQPRNDEILAEM